MPRAGMILAAALVAGFALVASVADPIARFPTFAIGTALATCAWLALAARVMNSERDGKTPTRAFVTFAILAAIAGRALLLVPEMALSDDLYRYLWDGRVANGGINPYLYPPNAPELDGLRNEISQRVNHPDLPTLYPPVAQLAFRALDFTGVGPRGVRACAALCDLAAALVIALALRCVGRSPALALVHATCPLAVLETAGGGHVDAFGVLLLSMATLFAASVAREASAARAFAAGVFFGGAALVKLVPVALAPALFARRPAREFLALGAGVALAALTIVPFVDAGERMFAGILTYARNWHFHSFAYVIATNVEIDSQVARRLLAVAFAFVAVATPIFVKERAACVGVVFGGFLLLSPTVHPWYALWLVPYLVFLPVPIRPAAFALVALLPFSYVTAWRESVTGIWEEPAWSGALTWGTVVVLLAIGIVQGVTSRAERTDASPRA